jgi:hypothetical protein
MFFTLASTFTDVNILHKVALVLKIIVRFRFCNFFQQQTKHTNSHGQISLSYWKAPLSHSEATLSYSVVPLSYSEAPLSHSEAPLSYSEASLSYSVASLSYSVAIFSLILYHTILYITQSI